MFRRAYTSFGMNLCKGVVLWRSRHGGCVESFLYFCIVPMPVARLWGTKRALLCLACLCIFFCSCGLLVVLMRLLHSWSFAWSCYSLVQWWFQRHYAFVLPFYMLRTRVGWQIRQIRKIWVFSLSDCILWKLNAVSTVLNYIKRTIDVSF